MTPAATIRDALESDLARVLEINEAGLPALNSLTIREVEWFFRVAAYFRVGELDGRVVSFLIGLTPGVGYASPNYRYFTQKFEQFLYVDRIAVSEEARRQGIAWAMYEDFERFASARGLGVICAEVNVRPYNGESITFHERFGFRRLGEQDTEGGAKRVVLLAREVGQNAAGYSS